MNDNSTTKTSNKAESHAFLGFDVIGSECSMHKPKQLGYLQWHNWAEHKTKQGTKQKQCQECGRWYFGDEF